MPNYDATSGPAEIVASGTVIAYRGNPIAIKFGRGIFTPTGGNEFSITFHFISTVGIPTPGPDLQVRVVGPTSIEFILSNYNNPLGIGTTEPIHIANFQNVPFFLSFRVYSLAGQTDKTLQFTVYRDKGSAPNG